MASSARSFLKTLAFGLAVCAASPFIVVCRLEAALFSPRSERAYGFCKELLATLPTLVGSYVRAAFYWAVCTNVARDVQFWFGSMVAHRDVRIGRKSAIGPYSIVGYADIGEDVLVGARVSILSGKYQHGRPDVRRDAGQPRHALTYSRVVIGDHCWIGEQSVIMANLGRHCTVGAGTVVTRDFGDDVTIFGNPGRRVNIEALTTPTAAEM